jgi:hypothetical protein
VAPRGEIVAREAPGPGQAGIAVLRGNDRVQLLGERDGWSEIRLGDGRRAWVPTVEIARAPEPAPRVPEPSQPTNDPPVASSPEPRSDTRELANEIERLRRVTDDLAAWRTNLPTTAPAETLPEMFPWALGAAFVAGIAIGVTFERRRNRRERALKF